MILKVQVISLIISFLYGILFYVTTYKYKYYRKIFLIVFLDTLIYFYALIKVNNGIIHIYMLLMIILGYILIRKILNK